MAMEHLQSQGRFDQYGAASDDSDNSDLDIDNSADDDNLSDTSSDLTEVQSEEFPLYFVERHERLYSSIPHGGHYYPLPIDSPEQERLRIQHTVLRYLLRANYVGPVPQLLAPEHGRRKRVVDLCTGSGNWVTEMANEFPHARFRGIDIVPIADRRPPRNVMFEIHDVNRRLRWHDNSVDLVHARDVALAVDDIHNVLQEVARILRPGGLFISCEWERRLAHDPSLNVDPHAAAPNACQFFNIVESVLRNQGIPAIETIIPTWFASTGQFRQVTLSRLPVPIGAWHHELPMQRVGRAFLGFIERYATSMAPVLVEAGHAPEEVAELLGGLMHDLRSVPGMAGVYHIVCVRKI